MKILMTGYAARGVGSTKVRHQITSLPDVIADCLRQLGHEVDGPRRVRPDEDLRGVGSLWLQVGWTSSLSSTYAHEAASLAARMPEERIVRFVDDWRSQELADDIQGHVLSEKGWARHVTQFRRDVYDGMSPAQVGAIRRALARPVTGSPLLVPTMGWGDVARFDVSRHASLSAMVPFDPQRATPLDQPERPSDGDRQRRWVLASLQEHDRWAASLGLSWPLLRMGANRKNPGGVPVPGATNNVVPESEVVQAYADSWGVLSPEYLSAGSGYWRTRWMQSAAAGSVLWPGPTDAEAAGRAYVEADPANLEGMSDRLLGDLASWQSEQCWSSSWSVEQLLDTLQWCASGDMFRDSKD